MQKTFEFIVKGHQIRITNSWLYGAKLYVDGDFRDQDKTFLAFGSEPLLSASLGEKGILEIYPLSALVSVEMDAYLTKDRSKQHVYSSHKRLTLREQRLVR